MVLFVNGFVRRIIGAIRVDCKFDDRAINHNRVDLVLYKSEFLVAKAETFNASVVLTVHSRNVDELYCFAISLEGIFCKLYFVAKN